MPTNSPIAIIPKTGFGVMSFSPLSMLFQLFYWKAAQIQVPAMVYFACLQLTRDNSS
jgi:hypothetical protein